MEKTLRLIFGAIDIVCTVILAFITLYLLIVWRREERQKKGGKSS